MQSRAALKEQKTGAPTKASSSLRCGCGSLLARMVETGVEIKCRRCKRQVIVPIDAKGTLRMNV